MSDIETRGMEDIAVACRRRAQESSSYRTTLLDAADEIESLRHAMEEQAKDAERYRWLRVQPNDTTAPRIDVVQWMPNDDANVVEGLRLEQLDAAIDAAIAAGKEEK